MTYADSSLTASPFAGPAPALAFSDKATAKAWLAAQPQTDPVPMLGAVLGQLRAITVADLAVDQAFILVSVLRKAAVPLLLGVESRFQRKALPLPPADQALYDVSQGVWQALVLADLGLQAKAPPELAAQALLRSALALRHAYFACFQGAQAIPAALDSLWLAIFRQGLKADVLTAQQSDPDFADLAPYTIGGELLWALLLRIQDVYHWSAVQLTVANRIVRRWHTLLSFQKLPVDDPKAAQIALSRVFPGQHFEGVPQWVDLRPILRKIRQRQEALAAGQSPVELKLGNELSATACQRLLTELAQGLRQQQVASAGAGECELMFGGEHAYAFFLQQILNKTAAHRRASIVAHQRMEIFGFDELSRLPGQAPKLLIPSETWQVVEGVAQRPVEAGGRHVSPALIAGLDANGVKRLGALQALRASPSHLFGRIVWFAGTVCASHIEGIVKHGMPIPKYPVFLLEREMALQLVAPANAGLQRGDKVKFAEGDLAPVELLDVSTRGADFVIFSCRPA